MTSLSHVQINVSDASISIPFYKDLFTFLGYTIIDEKSDHLGVSNGTTDFWILQTEHPYKKNGFHRKNIGINHFAFHVDSREEVDTFFKNFLQNKNIPTLYESPKTFPEYTPKYYAVFFEDPDRIKLEIMNK